MGTPDVFDEPWFPHAAVTTEIRQSNVSAPIGFTSFDVSIAIDSVDSSNERLDSHLKSPDFFNAVEFPTMSFKSSSVKSVGDNKYEVTGEITMHGVTKPLTVNMEKTGHVDGRRGEMVGFETEFELNRSEFGMNYGVESGSLGDKVKVIVALEAKRSGSD